MKRPEHQKERKMTPKEALKAMPKTPSGFKHRFQKKPKKNRIEKILGDRLIAVSIRGPEMDILTMGEDDLTPSEIKNIQKILDEE